MATQDDIDKEYAYILKMAEANPTLAGAPENDWRCKKCKKGKMVTYEKCDNPDCESGEN